MILKVAFDQPTRKAFDYFGVEGEPLPEPGTRIQARLGKARRIGLVMAVSDSSVLPLAKIRGIDRTLDGGQPILPGEVIETVRQVATSNVLPIGKLAFAALPPYARRNAKDIVPPEVSPRPEVQVDGNEQPKGLHARALNDLFKQEMTFAPHLVSGSPGSGKSSVCLEAIATTVRHGKTCLVLVPEINALQGWKERISGRIPGITIQVAHAGLGAKERMDCWWKAMLGGCHVLIGTRSAVFMPMASLGLVCVINENSPLLRSERGLLYSARDMAAIRGRLASCPLLMSSATPSLELRLAAQEQKINMTVLPPPTGQPRPNVKIVDIANRRLFGGVSMELENALRQELQRSGLSVVLVNQRGRFGFLFCSECRLRLKCQHCGHLLSSQSDDACQCRRCGHLQSMPKACPGCGGKDLVSMRSGSVRVAETLATRLPEARILRIDADTDHKKMTQELRDARPDIIVGSKLLLGLDLRPGTCCVSDADSILYSQSFRAAEQLLDTLTKLTASGPEVNLLVQTRFASHHVFEAIKLGSYDTFAFAELAERKSAGLSPYRRLALFRATGKNEDSVAQAVGSAKYLASECMPRRVTILEPVPAPSRDSSSTMQLLINSPDRRMLQESVSKWASLLEEQPMPKSVEWEIVVDPESW